MTHEIDRCYIDGAWIPTAGSRVLDIVDPATEAAIGRLTVAEAGDVDRAVRAARRAFDAFAATSVDERASLLERLLAEFEARLDDAAAAITAEMGAPESLARRAQAPLGVAHLRQTVAALRQLELERDLGTTRIVHDPVGVCALITPWNWPINQVACKVAPALAAGCAVVLKPSELAPLSARVFAEAVDRAGLPPGVFNLVFGDGPTTGAALAAHEDVDMVSFTGSTSAGIAVARAAAPTVKRVAQELGGKSALIVLDDADLERAVGRCVRACMTNSGQSCDAPTRLLVPRGARDAAVAAARTAVEGLVLGPVSGRAQWEKVQGLIERGIAEGATLVAGGAGRPEGVERGWFARPTVFADVTPDMTVAREEIFGPVLCLLTYDDEDDAVRIANDSDYGLAGYVVSGDLERARRVGRRLRAGQIHLNGAPHDTAAPFGGFKRSGNGREWGRWGIEEYLEPKALLGYTSPS